jgi:hypothetical protein
VVLKPECHPRQVRHEKYASSSSPTVGSSEKGIKVTVVVCSDGEPDNEASWPDQRSISRFARSALCRDELVVCTNSGRQLKNDGDNVQHRFQGLACVVA